MNPKASTPTVDPLWEAYKLTKSVHKAAEQFGISGETARRMLIRSGHKLIRSAWSKEEDETALRLFQTQTDREIALVLGRTEISVSLRRSRLNRGIAEVNSTTRRIHCAVCGTEFVSFKGSEYCSRKCFKNSGIPAASLRENAIKNRLFFLEQQCATCGAPFTRTSKTPTKTHCSISCGQLDYKVAKKRIVATRANPLAQKTGYPACKRGWTEVGGQRVFFRSSWERNYAFYLQWMIDRGEIAKWEHEPETFWFEKIKRGVRSYLPDFRVTLPCGAIEYHEVKGWMDQKSKTKIKRLAKYYPSIKLVVVDTARYKAISKTASSIVPGWTK